MKTYTYNKKITIVILAFCLVISTKAEQWKYYTPDLTFTENVSGGFFNMFYDNNKYIYYTFQLKGEEKNYYKYKLDITESNAAKYITCDSDSIKFDDQAVDNNNNLWSIHKIAEWNTTTNSYIHKYNFAIYDTTLKCFKTRPYYFTSESNNNTLLEAYGKFINNKKGELFFYNKFVLYNIREDSIIGKKIISLKDDNDNLNLTTPLSLTSIMIEKELKDFIVYFDLDLTKLTFLNYNDPWDLKQYDYSSFNIPDYLKPSKIQYYDNKLYIYFYRDNSDLKEGNIYVFDINKEEIKPLNFEYLQQPINKFNNIIDFTINSKGQIILLLYGLNPSTMAMHNELIYCDINGKFINAYSFPKLLNQDGMISTYRNIYMKLILLNNDDIVFKIPFRSDDCTSHYGILKFKENNNNITDDNENINNNIYISNINPSIINYENTELIVDFSCTPEQLNNLKIKISNNLGMSNENIKYDILYFDAYSSTGKLKININDNISNNNYLLNNGIYFITLYSYNKKYTKSFLYLK